MPTLLVRFDHAARGIVNANQELSRRDTVWLELCHILNFQDLVAVDVILQLKLDDECDEETYESGNERPRKSLNRCCSEHRKGSNDNEVSRQAHLESIGVWNQ
jgi:hypothetical protein